MNLDDVFKTRTLARILASQGQHKKAAAIYKHLLRQPFDQPDLKAELVTLKIKMNAEASGSSKELSSLYRLWIDTAVGYYRSLDHAHGEGVDDEFE